MTATSQSPRRRHFIEWVFCLLLMVLAAPAGAATKNIQLVIAAVQNRGATVRLTDPQPPVARAFQRVVNQ